MTAVVMDKSALKPRLREYLEAEGIAIPDRDKPKVCCVAHDESNPSMIVNAEYAKCFSCGFAGDVFKVAGAIHNNDNFKDQIQIVAQKLGVKIEKPEKPKPVAISAEKAKEAKTITAEYIETDECDGIERKWYAVSGYCHQTGVTVDGEYAVTSDGGILNGDGIGLTEGDDETVALHNVLG
jgi:hypothetical protein